MPRILGVGAGKPPRVAIADDSALIYSDDYRQGWRQGFEGIGCEVKVFDIAVLRKAGSMAASPYRSRMMPGTSKALAEEILKWKPHLVWCHHGRAASNEEFLMRLRREGVKVAVYLCDEPYETGETARYSPRFSHVFTMDWCTMETHRLARTDRSNVYYLPPAANTSHFQHCDYAGRTTPAFFLGNANLIPRPEWLRPIERLVDGADIRFFGTVGKGHPKWVPYAKHHTLYGSCRVGLNVHRDPRITFECYSKRVKDRPKSLSIPANMKLWTEKPRTEGTGFWNDANLPASHINPRFMEMAACGTLVVSDDSRTELARLFPMAPRAQDPDHFTELVLYYLNNPNEADSIGRACYYLISKRHSYEHRAAEALIRVGLKESLQDDRLSSLGEPAVWLTPQESGLLAARSSSDPTGPSERWSPRSGMLSIGRSGSPKDSDSLDVPRPWLS